MADGTLQPAGWFLAKVEDPRDIEIIRALDPARRPLVATLESARGMAAASAIAKAPGPDDALALGGADLAADLGADFAFEPLLLARLSLVQAAAAAGVAALDVPLLDLADATALTVETRRVRALGFTGKLAIHPAQVQTVLDAFRPTVEEIDRARRTLDALAAAGGGVARIDGRMIDEPLARSARRVLARAGHPIA